MKKVKSWFAASLAAVSAVSGSGVMSINPRSVWAESSSASPWINQLVAQTTEAAIIAKTKQNSGNTAGNLGKSTPFTDQSLEVARMIPENAYGLVAINAKSESWLHMKHHGLQDFKVYQSRLLTMLDEVQDGNPEMKALFKDIISQSPQLLDANITVAFVPSAVPSKTPSSMVNLVSWIAITDRGAANSLLDRIQSSSKTENTKITYKGVTIREWKIPKTETEPVKPSGVEGATPPKPSATNPPPAVAQSPNQSPDMTDDSLDMGEDPESAMPSATDDYSPAKMLASVGYGDSVAVAVLKNNYIMIAPNTEMIKATIDGVPNNLRQSPKFLRTSQNPQWEDSLITTYGSYGMLVKLLEKFAEDMPENSEFQLPGTSRKEYLEGLKATVEDYDTFDGFFWVSHTALRSRSHSYYTKVKEKPFPQVRRPVMPYLLPSNAYMSATSGNFKEQWQAIVTQAERYPGVKILVNPVREFFKENLAMDFDKDLISWMDGEYGFVIYPSKNAPFMSAGSDLSLGLLLRTSDPKAANAAMAKIIKKIQDSSMGIANVRQRFASGIALTSVEIPDPDKEGGTISAFSYGWRDSQTLLLSAGINTVSDFAPGPKPNLAEFNFFKDAAAQMPQTNLGYFYVNARSVAEGTAKLFFEYVNTNEDGKPGTVPPEVTKVIERLGGFMVSYSESTDRIQADSYLGVKPLMNP